MISRLAEKQLTPKPDAAFAELLEPGESLADASHWADGHRGQMLKTAPWHYADVPLDGPKHDARFSGDVSTKHRVVDEIKEFQEMLEDEGRSVEDRRFALRLLIHCIDDMHQPCHVGDNRITVAIGPRFGSSRKALTCTPFGFPASSNSLRSSLCFSQRMPAQSLPISSGLSLGRFARARLWP